jgi:hypothetical protein
MYTTIPNGSVDDKSGRVRAAAASYLARGLVPIPLRERSKQPLPKGWERITIDGFDLDALFPNARPLNVGLSLGEPSGGLIDCDLDCPEARAAAAVLMPPTGMVWGRQSAPDSHRGYVVADPPRKASHPWDDPLRRGKGARLLELRSTSGQTVVPPSVLPGDDAGKAEEPCVWHRNGEPAGIDLSDLRRAMGRVAAAALIGRYWRPTTRHDSALALAGGLTRAGWDADEVAAFVRAVCAAAGDGEDRDRQRAVSDTVAAVAAGEAATGWPTLAKLLGDGGEQVVSAVREWLGVRNPDLLSDELRDPAPATSAGGACDDTGIHSARPAAPPGPLAAPRWPGPMAEEAFHGPAGRFVRAVEPASEADPVALLVQFLLGVGNLVGRTAQAVVEGDRHHTNEYAVLVGRSAKGRKGTSMGRVKATLSRAEARWAEERVTSGLSSGEGVIWGVRDPIEKQEKVSERGQAPRYEAVVADPGVEDKRLFVIEPEFANVLKQTERQGNTLSAVLRQGWETGDLRSLTKNNPAKATGAHLSIVGHITDEELRRYLSATESANGFGNRFLWFLVRRSKLLPDGGTPDLKALAEVERELSEVVAFARTVGEIARNPAARELWREVYPVLSADRTGLAGSLTGRAEAHVLRLSVIYAVLDRSPVVRPEHLAAALAVWEYADESVRCIFGDTTGNPLADDILALLRNAPSGMTRTEVREMAGKNLPADRIAQALGVLLGLNLARFERRETGGRPVELWFAVTRRASRE